MVRGTLNKRIQLKKRNLKDSYEKAGQAKYTEMVQNVAV